MASNHARTIETGANRHQTPSEHNNGARRRPFDIGNTDENINQAIGQIWPTGETKASVEAQTILKTKSEVSLMRGRRVFFNNKIRLDLEHACEDKVSKYKLEELHTSLPSSNKSTFIMTFSPDGQRAASTHGDHRIYICDLNTGKLLGALEGHSKTPWCLAWHPINKDILASGCLAGEVRVWDLKSKACESWTSPNNTIITSLDFHPKERVLVIATASDIHFWDWSESEPFVKTTTSHDKEKVKLVLFDSSGTKLITGISNLPKFPGYIGDSLQNRILDSYLTQRTYDQLSNESMTSGSDITGGPFVMSAVTRSPILTVANEQSLNYRCTLVLNRIAHLYRNLEGLEDSMRHTSFSPIINPQVFDPNNNSQTNSTAAETTSTNNQEQLSESNRATTRNLNPLNDGSNSQKTLTLTDQNKVKDGLLSPSSSSEPQQDSSTQNTNTLEPLVVSFDELLANLRLAPLMVDGRQLSLDLIVEQYPSVSAHSMMQNENINQVNQNFIRISKLMSSIRLYRQIVQQVASNNCSSRGHYLPNQILTVQNTASKSSRIVASSPIVSFRGISSASAFNPNHLDREATSSDPIMAIQFRNSARNVPLMNLCKIDLLISRSVFIMRSQHLLEQIISNPSPFEQAPSDQRSDISESTQNQQDTRSLLISSNSQPCFYPLINQIHQSLHVINRAPLTTSNVHTHISSLRGVLNNLLRLLATMFQSREEGERLVKLVYDIAHSLTNRTWNMPLGATFNNILLDVIHTVCVVDLTLHLTRHIQLVQLQRLSALARIEESQTTGTNPTFRNSNPTNLADQEVVTSVDQSEQRLLQNASFLSDNQSSEPGPSSGQPHSVSGSTKRKECSNCSERSGCKKTKFDYNNEKPQRDVNDMIEAHRCNHKNIRNKIEPRLSCDAHTSSSGDQQFQANNNSNIARNPASNAAESSSTGNFLDWSSTSTSQLLESSIPRFLFATSSMNTSQMVWRIYQRLHGSTTAPTGSPLDNFSHLSSLPQESRRRALSQDNTVTIPTNLDLSQAMNNAEHARGRQLYVSNFVLPQGLSTSAGSSGGLALEPLLRNSFVHFYQARPHHIWFNHWTIPLSVSVSNSNYRLQCWNFSMSAIPDIKDSHSNLVTQKCRIHNDSSVDISRDGKIIACLVPRDDACVPTFTLKIFSLRSEDFGVCYHEWAQGPNAMSVSLSPSANFVVVGLASNKFISNDPNDDDLIIARVFKLRADNSHGHIRDIKIKRDDSALCLNAIRWMERGIVYNVGPAHHQRYQAARPRNRAL